MTKEKFRTPPHRYNYSNDKRITDDINADSIQKIEELSMKADRALMNYIENIKKYNLWIHIIKKKTKYEYYFISFHWNKYKLSNFHI